MLTGTVKWFSSERGLGLIQPDKGGKAVLIRSSVLKRAGLRGLRPGQKVRFGLVAALNAGSRPLKPR
jgi:CspA family cold shock protein